MYCEYINIEDEKNCMYLATGEYKCQNQTIIEKFDSVSSQEKRYNELTNHEKNFLKESWSICFSNKIFDWYEYGKIILIKNNNQLIGYVGCLTSYELCNWLEQNNMYQQKDMYGVNSCGDTGMYIYNLCIVPKFRRKKVASKVMKNIINRCKSYIYLWVYFDNTPAIELYKSLNFNIDKTVNTINGEVYIMKYVKVISK